jgi:hypothetical protein
MSTTLGRVVPRDRYSTSTPLERRSSKFGISVLRNLRRNLRPLQPGAPHSGIDTHLETMQQAFSYPLPPTRRFARAL